MTTATVTTTYLGFTIIVTHDGFTVLDRNGNPLPKVKTMQVARKQIAELRRIEREG